MGAFRKETFETLNGFSNQFWGWGGEAEEMSLRIEKIWKRQLQMNKSIGQFHEQVHEARESNNPQMMDSYSLIDFSACSANRSEHDGLNNLYFEKISDDNFHLIRKITVDLKYGDQSHEPRVLCPGDRI